MRLANTGFGETGFGESGVGESGCHRGLIIFKCMGPLVTTRFGEVRSGTAKGQELMI